MPLHPDFAHNTLGDRKLNPPDYPDTHDGDVAAMDASHAWLLQKRDVLRVLYSDWQTTVTDAFFDACGYLPEPGELPSCGIEAAYDDLRDLLRKQAKTNK